MTDCAYKHTKYIVSFISVVDHSIVFIVALHHFLFGILSFYGGWRMVLLFVLFYKKGLIAVLAPTKGFSLTKYTFCSGIEILVLLAWHVFLPQSQKLQVRIFFASPLFGDCIFSP